MENNNRKFKQFATVDIETINLNGRQIPVLISNYDATNLGNLFEINRNYLKNRDSEGGVKSLFNKYFKFLVKSKVKLIFAHNLGGFDGYFIIKYLYHYTKDPKLVDLMLDKNNKFIKITLSESYKSKGKINRRELFTFKDSMRLLGGVSLNTLCKIYGVTQKLCEYKPIWNTLSLFLETTPLRGKRVT